MCYTRYTEVIACDTRYTEFIRCNTKYTEFIVCMTLTKYTELIVCDTKYTDCSIINKSMQLYFVHPVDVAVNVTVHNNTIEIFTTKRLSMEQHEHTFIFVGEPKN